MHGAIVAVGGLPYNQGMISQGIAQWVSENVVNKWLVNPSLRIAVAMVLLFFVITSALAHQLQPLTNSPDEMVTRAFVHEYEATSALRIPAPVVAVEEGLAPRSVSFREGAYVPATFYGMLVLYGGVAKVLGVKVFWILTPLIASIACLAFFGLVRRVWGDRIAMTSVMLLCLHPAWWYYTARGLYPNVLVVSLIIIGLWLVLIEPMRSAGRVLVMRVANHVLGMGVLALAAFVRPVEMVWVGLLLLAAAIIYRAWKDRVLVWIWGTALIVCMGVVGLYPGILGSVSGYVIALPSFLDALFPFGIHPRLVLHNMWNIGFLSLGFVGVVSAGALGVVLVRWILARALFTTERGKYILLTLAWIWYPILMYGSWIVRDNPTPELVTIGSSFFRYWLPVFVVVLPFVAYVLWRVFERFRSEGRRYMAGIWMGFFVCWFGASMLTGASGVDGFASLLRERDAVVAVRERVLARVPESSVIIVDKWDKHFWPARTVTRVRKSLAVDQWFFGLVLRADESQQLAGATGGRVVEVDRFGTHALYHIEK